MPFTGDYEDGLGNKITMIAYANIESDNKRNDGFGLIVFNKKNSTVTFNSWPRYSNLMVEDTPQMKGWPRTIKRIGFPDNFKWKLYDE